MADEKVSRKEMGLEELAYLERLYQNQYMLVGNAINSALEEMQQLNSANKSIESMDLITGKESFSNIGEAFYLKSKIEKKNSIVVGVGGGYLVEKELENAKEYIKERIEKKNGLLDKLMKNRKEIEAAVLELSSKIDGMTKRE